MKALRERERRLILPQSLRRIHRKNGVNISLGIAEVGILRHLEQMANLTPELLNST